MPGPPPRRTAPPPKKAPPPAVYRAGEASRTPAARPDRPNVKPSSVILLSLLFSPLLFAYFLVGDRGFLEVRRQREKLKTLQAEVAALDAANRKLADDVEGLQKDPAAIEKVAREELGLVAPGDVVVVLPPGWKELVTPKRPAARAAVVARTPSPTSAVR